MKFSIGYNEKDGFLKILEDYRDNISSVYFPLPKELGSSGRPSRQEEGNYHDKVTRLLKKCKELGIETILLLNSSINSSDTFSKEKIGQLFDYIEKNIENGLSSITITNMLYMKLLKKKFPSLRYFASVNCRIKNEEQAIYFKKLGIDVITLDRDINRDVDLIKRIKNKTGLDLQLMLNEPCIKNCPYRNTHFETVAYNSEQVFSGEFEDYTCYPMMRENKKLIFRIPFIRPEDMKHYKGIISHYKLVTRDASNEKIKFLLDTYISENYNGNVVDLFDIEKTQYIASLYIDNSRLNELNFFDRIRNCLGDCDNCNICDVFLEK